MNTFNEKNNYGTMILSLGDSLCKKNADYFSYKLENIINKSKPNDSLILNFENINIVDYNGIIELVTAIKKAKLKNIQIIIASVKPHLIKLFGEVGVNSLAPVL